MKYVYQYKSADNIQHAGKVHASSRERAFDKIKARGHKPFRLELAPGIGNKILIHLMKWGAAESALVAALTITLVIIGLVPVKNRPAEASAEAKAQATEGARLAPQEKTPLKFETSPRAQIAGIPQDYPSRLDRIFLFSSERFLALHAMPGVMLDTNGESLEDLEEAIESPIASGEGDEEWVASLKKIVAGMKEEAAILLKSGKTAGDIEIWLAGRQNMESAYREQILESEMPEAQKRKTLKALGL